MANRIPSSFIQEVLAKTDITDLIGRVCQLKKMGNSLKGCCPFHNEKTPSFNVSAEKQVYHCFGCGASGNALGFVMQFENLEFIDALEELARRVGLTLPKTSGGYADQVDHEPLWHCLEQATQYYSAQLKKSPAAIAYLEARGIDSETALTYRLGYAPVGWDNLLKHLNKQTTDNIVTAGLAIKNDRGRIYDRFRDRIIFPISDRRGRIIGFGGRTMGDDQPKYLNSPETPLFHKSQALYGFHQLLKCRDTDDPRIFITEGYMDVIAMHQHGLQKSVATLGTATSAHHIQRLVRTTPHLVFCFDGDKAGQKAAWHALEVALPVIKDGDQLDFVFLPDGEDPDSVLKAGGQSAFLREVSEHTRPLPEFLIDKLCDGSDLDRIDSKAGIIDSARPLLNKLNAESLKEIIIDFLAQKLDVSAERILKDPPKVQEPLSTTQHQYNSVSKRLTPIRIAIAITVQQPQAYVEDLAIDFLRKSGLPGFKLLYQLLEQVIDTESITTAMLLEKWRDRPEYSSLVRLSNWSLPFPSDGYADELPLILKRLQTEHYSQQLNVLLEDSKVRVLSDEEKAQLTGLLTKKVV